MRTNTLPYLLTSIVLLAQISLADSFRVSNVSLRACSGATLDLLPFSADDVRGKGSSFKGSCALSSEAVYPFRVSSSGSLCLPSALASCSDASRVTPTDSTELSYVFSNDAGVTIGTVTPTCNSTGFTTDAVSLVGFIPKTGEAIFECGAQSGSVSQRTLNLVSCTATTPCTSLNSFRYQILSGGGVGTVLEGINHGDLRGALKFNDSLYLFGSLDKGGSTAQSELLLWRVEGGNLKKIRFNVSFPSLIRSSISRFSAEILSVTADGGVIAALYSDKASYLATGSLARRRLTVLDPKRFSGLPKVRSRRATTSFDEFTSNVRGDVLATFVIEEGDSRDERLLLMRRRRS